MDYKKDPYLQHWGIKGMKWGVRRYQNKDGSLTDAGKKRRNTEYDGLNEKQRKKYKADPEEWARRDNTAAKRIAEESSHMTNKLKQINDKSMRNRPKEKMDLSNMTDEQMRREINRAMLERQYNDMFAPQKQARGREFASKFLEVGTDVLAVTGSALGIALAVQQLRTGKNGGGN
jgi:ribosomal protein S30